MSIIHIIKVLFIASLKYSQNRRLNFGKHYICSTHVTNIAH
jgi:hypothetical protein